MDRRTKVSIEIEHAVKNNPGMEYSEACLIDAQENEIDPIDMHKFVSDSLKSKLMAEGVKNKTLKGGNDSVSLEEYVK